MWTAILLIPFVVVWWIVGAYFFCWIFRLGDFRVEHGDLYAEAEEISEYDLDDANFADVDYYALDEVDPDDR